MTIICRLKRFILKLCTVFIFIKFILNSIYYRVNTVIITLHYLMQSYSYSIGIGYFIAACPYHGTVNDS